MNMSRQCSPIAVFAFKRPDHLLRALESLQANPEFERSPLYIFCDGPRTDAESAMTSRAQAIAQSWSHPQKTVFVQPSNLGLARSICAGVGKLCDQYGRAIVVEDDLTVSRVYLRFMNDALNRYEHCEQVMQVAGHVFPANFRSSLDAVVLPFTSTYGWGTWRRAWKHFDPTMSGAAKLDGSLDLRRRFDLGGAYPYYEMLKAQMAGNVDSWGIKWYLTVFTAGGLCVFPKLSLVAHEFDGTGTHLSTPQYREQPLSDVAVESWPNPALDAQALEDFKKYIRKDRRLWNRVLRYFRSKLRR
jgi:hypothetical protein